MDFKNTIIILTSNLGSTTILDGITEVILEAREQVFEMLHITSGPSSSTGWTRSSVCSPDISRSRTDHGQPAGGQADPDRLSPEAKEYVADQGYDPVYGARPLKRFIQRKVETIWPGISSARALPRAPSSRWTW